MIMNTEKVLVEAKLRELELIVTNLRANNTELNRRLSAQNRPGKQLANCIEVATILLSAHVSGGITSRNAFRVRYNIGRRRWLNGVGLLRLSNVVVKSDTLGLTFNERLSILRAWERLHGTAQEVANNDKGFAALAAYVPQW